MFTYFLYSSQLHRNPREPTGTKQPWAKILSIAWVVVLQNNSCSKPPPKALNRKEIEEYLRNQNGEWYCGPVCTGPCKKPSVVMISRNGMRRIWWIVAEPANILCVPSVGNSTTAREQCPKRWWGGCVKNARIERPSVWGWDGSLSAHSLGIAWLSSVFRATPWDDRYGWGLSCLRRGTR